METKDIIILENESVTRTFFKYLIPSLLGVILMVANYLADGIMIGQKEGEIAFAGVGAASPVYTIFLAMAIGIGIGGSTLYSQAMGAKNKLKAQKIFTQSIVMIGILTILVGGLAYFFKEQLAYAIGATPESLPYAIEYMNVILLFGFIFTVEDALSIFIRNDGNPNLATAGLVVTAMLNIILNYIFLFILEWGVFGAATATIVASFVGFCVLATHFVRPNCNLKLTKYKLDIKLSKRIITIGLASFLVEGAVVVFSVSHYNSFRDIAGTSGIAAFAAIHHLHAASILIFMGIGLAVQPLISYYMGAGKKERIKQTLKVAIITTLSFSISLIVIAEVFARPILGLFGDLSAEVIDIAVLGIRLFIPAYIFMGINLVMMTYYQTTGKSWIANTMTIAREVVLMLLFLFTLPYLFGIKGIWLAVPLSELSVFLAILAYQSIYGYKLAKKSIV